MLKSSLCDYSNLQILVKRTITVAGARETDAARATYRNNREAIFKKCGPFRD